MKITTVLLLVLFQLAAAGQVRHIYVAQDGSGNFLTVQAALNAVAQPNNTPVIIHIKPGVYREVVVLDSGKNFVSFKGKAGKSTLITYNNHTGKMLPDGKLANTRTSASFFIYADDFSAENIHFENNAGFTAGQAVAVRADGNRLSFRNCKFTGFQDVLFLNNRNAKHFFQSCYIEGTTDFIFGDATAVFDHCAIRSKKNSHITAASTEKNNPFGFVFYDCKLTSDSATNKVSLGRPWQPYASVTYINCKMGKHIIPAGWDNWKNPKNELTARYAEYHSRGPGANMRARIKWSRQLTKKELKNYRIKNILGSWEPYKNKI